jgi:hypothetical protein
MTGTAIVRTFVQWGLAKLLASAFGVAAVTFLTEQIGFEINREALTNGVTALLMAGVIWAVNHYGKRFAWINKIVSLGLSRTGPAYVPNDADAVVSVAVSGGPDTVNTVDTPPPGPNPAPFNP